MGEIDKTREALLKRAYGYEYEEKEIIASRDGKEKKIKVTKKHVPPDMKALALVRYLKSIGAL